jgi:hypothetical protein
VCETNQFCTELRYKQTLFLYLHFFYIFSEGWEKLGLYEYYKAKNAARKNKEEAIAHGRREKSRSPTPIPKDLQKQPTPPGRRYK